MPTSVFTRLSIRSASGKLLIYLAVILTSLIDTSSRNLHMTDQNSKNKKPKNSSDAPKSLQKILIVDDDNLIKIGLEKFFKKKGYQTISAGTGKSALNFIENEANLSLVLLDLKLPDSFDGLAILEIIKNTRPDLTVVIISGQTEIRGAVEAMKLGALDYMEKPLDFDRIEGILELIEAEANKPSPSSADLFDDLICTSDQMKQIVKLMQRLSLKSDITILVTGESGTGKNFLFQKMHELSPRRNFPYVQIGCANIPEHLIESELFGYEKGAFTDAKNSKKGLVEIADGGSMLLDELGEMPYAFQAKILRLLEEKCFRRIGALQDTNSDLRIFAATNKNLYQLVQEKKFRLDLFYRLNAATIELPPLRDRSEDIPPLAEHFLKTFSEKYACAPKTITAEGMLALQHYSWPGNIRQLKNLIEKLVVLTEDDEIPSEEIKSNLLIQQQMEKEPDNKKEELDTFSGLSLAAMEEKHIKTALRLSGGNQRKAAKLLKISRDTLRYRLKKLGI